jgi:hypothetical protein
MKSRTSLKKWTRFSVLTLLLAMLFVGGMLAGYRVGFERGYSAGEFQRQREMPVAKVYDVADLVLPSPDASPDLADYSSLIDLITSTIAPESWNSVGGSGSCEAFPTNLSLVVSQTPHVHEQVAALLETLRWRSASKETDGSHAAPDGR